VTLREQRIMRQFTPRVKDAAAMRTARCMRCSRFERRAGVCDGFCSAKFCTQVCARRYGHFLPALMQKRVKNLRRAA
jgi:hypothetical protein